MRNRSCSFPTSSGLGLAHDDEAGDVQHKSNLSVTSSSRILRIDSTTQIDSCIWNDVRLLIESTENLYPGIDLWLRRKVEPGLRDGSRLCYAAVQDDQPKAVVILKKGYPSKLCTLRVVPEAEGQRLGTLLMLAIARELPRPSEYVYFTIPESVWASCAPFYGNFGFEMRGFAKERYRRGDRELFCVAENRQILRTYIGQVCALYRRYRHDENC